MPFSKGNLSKRFVTWLLILQFAMGGAPAWAVEESEPLHWSGDHTLWDRKSNRVELTGHAAVHQPGESLTADHIVLDLDARTLDARGNCIYVAAEAVIYGEEMHFNLDTRTGTIVNGRVVNDRFTLTGERINKLGEGRFQTHQGDYSTCRDCPRSWTFHGGDVDMAFGGYAYMSNVIGKVRDAPVFWMPFLVVPLKTQRQTGLLFPRFGFVDGGFRFVLPFFWATSRTTDMTFGAGHWGRRGSRLEWEGRYMLSGRSAGQVNGFYLHDQLFENYLQDVQRLPGREGQRITPHRWALNIGQVQELPFGIEQKFRFTEVSDNFYPTSVGDVPGSGDAFLSSDLIFSRAGSQVSAYLAARRFRNLLYYDPLIFDPRTVQVYPTAAVTTNDRVLLNVPLVSGIALGVTNFSRTESLFDQNPLPDGGGPVTKPGVDPIRKATRVSVVPKVYTAIKPWGLFSLVPSAEYRSFFYRFPTPEPETGIPSIADLHQGYVLFRADLSFQLEKVYDTSNRDIPKVKHLFRPQLTYNRIPFFHRSDPAHPFLGQIRYASDNNFAGFNFDSNDIVPLDSSKTYNQYFFPLGESISYGFTTQLIRRRGAMNVTPSYQRIVELSAGQYYNFRAPTQPFSQFFSSLALSFDQWNGTLNYTYNPDLAIDETKHRNAFSLGFNYLLESSVRQSVLLFERSFNLAYSYSKTEAGQTNNIIAGISYSLSDYVTPRVSTSYDLNTQRVQRVDAGLRFQSPSTCWKMDIGFSRYICDGGVGVEGYCNPFQVDLSLNLVGGGYGGVGELASTVVK